MDYHLDSAFLDGLISQYTIDDLFDELPEAVDPSTEDSAGASSPDSISSWIGELESFLMKDDLEDAVSDSKRELSENFLAELLVEPPENVSGEVVDGKCGGDSDEPSDGGDHQHEKDKVEGEAAGLEEDVDDNPSSKKRTRQLRNKDAAARSRERKKMYVKELEMKSKYLEGECRRLGRLLQCFVADNQALRLGLQNGGTCGATGAKQESAVLLLESLLLGSLLWFLGIMCLFGLPISPQSTVSLGRDAEGRDLQTCSLRGPGNEELLHSSLESFVMSRRCKASRSKMKAGIPVPELMAC